MVPAIKRWGVINYKCEIISETIYRAAWAVPSSGKRAPAEQINLFLRKFAEKMRPNRRNPDKITEIFPYACKIL